MGRTVVPVLSPGLPAPGWGPLSWNRCTLTRMSVHPGVMPRSSDDADGTVPQQRVAAVPLPFALRTIGVVQVRPAGLAFSALVDR